MDYKTFLDVVLALQHKNDPSSIRYLFRIIDFKHQGAIDRQTVYYFFKDITKALVAEKIHAPSFADVVAEIFDMIPRYSILSTEEFAYKAKSLSWNRTWIETMASRMGQNAHRTENRKQNLSPPTRHGNAPVSTQEPFQLKNRFNSGTLPCSIQFFLEELFEVSERFLNRASFACMWSEWISFWPSYKTMLENERNFPQRPFFKSKKGKNFITGFLTGKCHVKVVILDSSHATTLHAVKENREAPYDSSLPHTVFQWVFIRQLPLSTSR